MLQVQEMELIIIILAMLTVAAVLSNIVLIISTTAIVHACIYRIVEETSEGGEQYD